MTRLPAEVEAFWTRTLAASRAAGAPASFLPQETPLRGVRVYDVRFSGFAGERIAAWLILPEGPGPHPAVVEYVGHGGGRGYPHEHLAWAGCGFAHLVMDPRGQGSGWRLGVTPDSGPLPPGSDAFFTRGITDEHDYFYRRMFADGVLAVDAIREHPDVDASRVAVMGTSQGGGVAVAVASLRGDVRATIADVPAFGAFPLAIELAEEGPYEQIARYLAVHRDEVDTVMRVLGFFDTTVLGPAATAPALFSLGGRDVLVPPLSIRAAIDAYGGTTEVHEYPFNGHEGGGSLHQLRAIEWLLALDGEGKAA
ncbi:acetylxylan esterase [Microbacterium sp.]|uniref:acetylxylan esterase n=1 Tax=Microbacterium sp. TaxID=51671 RepID=UPI00333E9876